jgi:hypothetical protein
MTGFRSFVTFGFSGRILTDIIKGGKSGCALDSVPFSLLQDKLPRRRERRIAAPYLPLLDEGIGSPLFLIDISIPPCP